MSRRLARSLRRALAVASAAALAFAVAGCGNGGESSEAATSDALVSLYVIDHQGANPVGTQLRPYETAFATLRDRCDGSVADLASSVQDISSSASNGSGTTITNLRAMRVVNRYLEQHPRSSSDCSGVFVGMEAYLEGDAFG